MEIVDLQKLVTTFRDERNWKQFHNAKDMALSLSLEASELMELLQWKNEEQSNAFFQSKPIELSDELADILYWLLLIAHDFKVDLVQSLKNKLEKNAQKYPVETAKNCSLKYDKL